MLKDTYDFEGFVRREHGQNFKIGLNVDLDFYTFDSEDRLNSGYKIYTAEIDFIDKNAIKDRWQFDQSYAFKIGDWSFSNDDFENYTKFNYKRFDMSQSFGYYMSRRTYASLSLYTTVSNWNQGDFNDFNIYAGFGYYYYVSPQTRLSCSGYYSIYSENNSPFDRYGQYSSLNIGLNYFFF